MADDVRGHSRPSAVRAAGTRAIERATDARAFNWVVAGVFIAGAGLLLWGAGYSAWYFLGGN